MMTRGTRSRWIFLGVAVVLVVLLAGCTFTSGEPPMTRVPMSPASGQGEQAASPQTSKMALPQVVSGSSGEAQGAKAEGVKAAVSGEVWKPREIAAQVQVALAKALKVDPNQVPYLRYEAEVATENLVCLDQLIGDIPPIADGEALVYDHEGKEIYVVGNQGQLWVCQKKE